VLLLPTSLSEKELSRGSKPLVKKKLSMRMTLEYQLALNKKEVKKSYFHMEAILAQRFSPLNFSVVPGFPNVVPTIDEWGDYLPRFREDKDDNPADHLLEFHEVMHQLGIHHEDVLMNMFMYSLEGYAREWYRSLPPASISSLKKFHATFSDHCKRFFPADLIFENCCEEFDLYMQNSIVGSSNSMNEKGVNVKQVEEESSPCEIFSSFSIQEEIFIDCSDDKKVDQKFCRNI
jgi:hypothetical protein